MEFVELFNNLSIISVVLFVLGLICIVAELFQPGFGIFGTLGIILLIADIFITAKTFVHGLIMAALIFVVLLIIFAIFIFFASKGRLPKSLVLKEALSTEQGFSGSDDMQYLVGKPGTVLTTCRPAGTVDFDGVKLDVVSRGEFIEKGSAVEVLEVEGNRIVVRARPPANLSI